MDGDFRLSREALREATLAGVRWLGVARIAAEALAVASMVTLAHLIPPEEFGRAAIALIAQALALVLAGDGLGTPLVQRRSVERAHLEATALLGLACGAGLTAATYLLAPLICDPLFGGRTTWLVQLISPVFALAAVGVVPQSILQRELDFARLSKVEIGALACGAISSVALALAGLDAEAVILGALATTAASTVLLLASTPLALPRWKGAAIREMATFGVPAALASLAHTGFRNVDYAILGAKLSAAQVGFYWRGFQFGVDYQRKVSGVMARIALPVYSRTESPEVLRALRSRIVRVQAATIFPALAMLIVLAPVLVPWLLGTKWEPAVLPTQILAVGGMAVAAYTGTGPLLLAAGKPSAMLVFNVARLAVYACAILLTAPYGLTAVCLAAVGIFVAQLVAAQYFLLRRLLEIPARSLRDDVAPAAVASIALIGVSLPLTQLMVGAALPSALTILCAGAAGAGAYMVVLRRLFRATWTDLTLLVRHAATRARSPEAPEVPVSRSAARTS